MSELQSSSLPLLCNARLELASLRRRIVLRGDCPQCREALELVDAEIVRGKDSCCWCKTVFQVPEALVDSRVKTLEAEATAKDMAARRIAEAREAKRAEQAARLAEVRSRVPRAQTGPRHGPRWAILHQPVDKFLEWCLFAGVLVAVAAVAVFGGGRLLQFAYSSTDSTEGAISDAPPSFGATNYSAGLREDNTGFMANTTEDDSELYDLLSTPQARAMAVRLANKDNQLTEFQITNGISDKEAEAAIMEWVRGHGGNFDWDLEGVKAICRRMKRQ